MSPLKIIVVAGARPNFIKVGPFLRAVTDHNIRFPKNTDQVEAILVHTGQHYDVNMSEVFFREMDIRPPDINLGIGSGSHAAQTAHIMTAFEAVCEREKPEWVVVVGDVNSTMACALVCAKLGVNVAHIEAGLRSFDRSMPEEINRIVTDALSELLLTPSEDADRNLRREGIAREKIRFVGNIMIDALVQNLEKARLTGIVDELGFRPGQFAYVTLHRPANVDSRANLTVIISALESISQCLPVAFPVHPRTSKMLAEFGLASRTNSRLRMFEPVGYHRSLSLAEQARLILTDSGGLQEEATYFRTPCLTLRPSTERPITITLGSNRLTSLERLPHDIDHILNGPERIGRVPPLWDGLTGMRCLEHILETQSTKERDGQLSIRS